MFLLQKIENTCFTKALRDSAAVSESQPTPAILICNGMLYFGGWHHILGINDLFLE